MGGSTWGGTVGFVSVGEVRHAIVGETDAVSEDVVRLRLRRVLVVGCWLLVVGCWLLMNDWMNDWMNDDVTCREGRVRGARLPFNHCALTFKPINPSNGDVAVVAPDGAVFNLEAVVPYIRKHHAHPVTGVPMALGDVTRIRFSTNPAGEICCPVLGKVYVGYGVGGGGVGFGGFVCMCVCWSSRPGRLTWGGGCMAGSTRIRISLRCGRLGMYTVGRLWRS